MELGAFSISLAVKDLEASRVFYEKLGFEVAGGDASQNWLILRNGGHTIGLFQGMFELNTLTFNPGLGRRRAAARWLHGRPRTAAHAEGEGRKAGVGSGRRRLGAGVFLFLRPGRQPDPGGPARLTAHGGLKAASFTQGIFPSEAGRPRPASGFPPPRERRALRRSHSRDWAFAFTLTPTLSSQGRGGWERSVRRNGPSPSPQPSPIKGRGGFSYAAAAVCLWKVRASSDASTKTSSPSANSPERTCLDSGFSRLRCIVRRSGLAP